MYLVNSQSSDFVMRFNFVWSTLFQTFWGLVSTFVNHVELVLFPLHITYYASNPFVFHITRRHGTWDTYGSQLQISHCDLCFGKVISKHNKQTEYLLVRVGKVLGKIPYYLILKQSIGPQRRFMVFAIVSIFQVTAVMTKYVVI